MAHLLILSLILSAPLCLADTVCRAGTTTTIVNETITIYPSQTSPTLSTTITVNLSQTSPALSTTTIGACQEGELTSNTCVVETTSTVYYVGTATYFITLSTAASTSVQASQAATPLRRAVRDLAVTTISQNYTTSTRTIIESYPAIASTYIGIYTGSVTSESTILPTGTNSAFIVYFNPEVGYTTIYSQYSGNVATTTTIPATVAGASGTVEVLEPIVTSSTSTASDVSVIHSTSIMSSASSAPNVSVIYSTSTTLTTQTLTSTTVLSSTNIFNSTILQTSTTTTTAISTSITIIVSTSTVTTSTTAVTTQTDGSSVTTTSSSATTSSSSQATDAVCPGFNGAQFTSLDGGKYNVFCDSDFPGNDIFNTSTNATILATPQGPVGPITVVDMESCINACFYVSGCVGVTWQAASSSCAFKYGLPHPMVGNPTRPVANSAMLVGIWPQGPNTVVPSSIVTCPANNTAVYQAPDGSFYNVICNASFPSAISSGALPVGFPDLQSYINSCFGVSDCTGVTWSPTNMSCSYYAESPNNPVTSTDQSAVPVGIYAPDAADIVNNTISTGNAVLNSAFGANLTSWTTELDLTLSNTLQVVDPTWLSYDVVNVILRPSHPTWAELSQSVSTVPGLWYELGFSYVFAPSPSHSIVSGELMLNCTAQDSSSLALLTNLSVSVLYTSSGSIPSQDSLGNAVQVSSLYTVSAGIFQATTLQTKISLGFYASVETSPSSGSTAQQFFVGNVTLVETVAPNADTTANSLLTAGAVLNAGFETGDLSNWTVINDLGSRAIGIEAYADGALTTEFLSVTLPFASPAWTQLVQNVSTVPGMWYQLNLTYMTIMPSIGGGNMSLNCTAFDAFVVTPLAGLFVSVDIPTDQGPSVPVDSLGNSVGYGYWSTVSVGVFQAESAMTEITLGFFDMPETTNTGGRRSFGIDNVTLIEVPAPSTPQDNYDFCRREAHASTYNSSSPCTSWDLQCTTGFDGLFSSYSSTGTGTIGPYSPYNTIISNGTDTVTVSDFKTCIDACALIGGCYAVTWFTELGACYYKSAENYNNRFDETSTYHWQSAVAVATC